MSLCGYFCRQTDNLFFHLCPSVAMLQVLYRLKTAKLFDEGRSVIPPNTSSTSSPFAIQLIRLCVESRLLCVAGSCHVALFSFSRQESQIECAVGFVLKSVRICFYSGLPGLSLTVTLPFLLSTVYSSLSRNMRRCTNVTCSMIHALF